MTAPTYNVTVWWRDAPSTPEQPAELATNYGYCYQPQFVHGGRAVLLEHAQSGRLILINLNAVQCINAIPKPEKVE